MDIEGSSGKHFANWDDAFSYYVAHFHKGCVHVLLPTAPVRSITPAPLVPSDSPKRSTRKVKSRTVKTAAAVSAASSRRRRRRGSSSSSAANYRSLYEDDDPIQPAIADLAPHLSLNPTDPHLPQLFSPGRFGNPIEVPSNFPTPNANQEALKRRKKPKGPGFSGPAPTSPTPTPTIPVHSKKPADKPTALSVLSAPSEKSSLRTKPDSSVLNTIKPLVYVCDCSDGGYSAPRVPSLKRKATTAMKAKSSATSVKRKAISTQSASATTSNAAASSSSHPVIEIFTDSEDDSQVDDTDTEMRPLPKRHFCKCFRTAFQIAKPLAPMVVPGLNSDHTSVNMKDSIPEVPRPSQD